MMDIMNRGPQSSAGGLLKDLKKLSKALDH